MYILHTCLPRSWTALAMGRLTACWISNIICGFKFCGAGGVLEHIDSKFSSSRPSSHACCCCAATDSSDEFGGVACTVCTTTLYHFAVVSTAISVYSKTVKWPIAEICTEQLCCMFSVRNLASHLMAHLAAFVSLLHIESTFSPVLWVCLS